jgi:hypothetical protein
MGGFYKDGSSRIGMGSMGWIDLAWNRDRWRALGTAAMNIRFPYNVGNFFTT